MKLVAGVHDEAKAVLADYFSQRPLKWTRQGSNDHWALHAGKYYRLCKDRGSWFLYSPAPGGTWDLVKPGEGPGFFEEGFGPTLAIAKIRARAWLQRGVTFNDDEWGA